MYTDIYMSTRCGSVVCACVQGWVTVEVERGKTGIACFSLLIFKIFYTILFIYLFLIFNFYYLFLLFINYIIVNIQYYVSYTCTTSDLTLHTQKNDLYNV